MIELNDDLFGHSLEEVQNCERLGASPMITNELDMKEIRLEELI